MSLRGDRAGEASTFSPRKVGCSLFGFFGYSLVPLPVPGRRFGDGRWYTEE
jgi:hypothetical protein